jgi:hypothetical protein
MGTILVNKASQKKKKNQNQQTTQRNDMTTHQSKFFNIVHYKRLENLEDVPYLHALGQKR